MAGRAATGMGMYKVFTGPSVVTTLSISLVWIIYTAIPPFLLMHYAWVHRPDGSVGASLRHTCWVLWWISSFCGIAAILLLWLVYPKQVRACPAYAPATLFCRHLTM